jgi:hypothetical protein
VENNFHQNGSKGCEKNKTSRLKATGRKSSIYHPGKPLPDTPLIRKTYWRSHRCIFSQNQYPAQVSLSGADRSKDCKNYSNVDTLQITSFNNVYFGVYLSP